MDDKTNIKDGSGREVIKTEYPSNTHKKREQSEQTKEEPRKIKKVVNGVVVIKKKSLGKRFIETFIGEDIGNVLSYITQDVLIPAAKSMLWDMISGGSEMMLFGERKSVRSSRDRGRSHYNYNGISSNRDYRDDRRDMTRQNRARHNFDDITIETRGEADEVINQLVDLTIDYGQATVADLYDMCGITAEFTDAKYGWTDLRSASATRARSGGYVLNLPKPIFLD